MVKPHRPVFGEISLPSPNVQKRSFDAPLASKVALKSKADLDRMFEMDIKLSTDNKINTKNSWDINLIDYFSDMNVLKEGDSINFQKASCTLDGCVKIYTSRMDSVDSDTKRLLSQLAESKDEDGDEPKKKKRNISSGATLEVDFSALNFKKLDAEFEVDPLFKKTSADFDEGGARGLLLNHLCVGQDGQVIFDASNVPGIEDDKANTFSSTTLNIGKLKDSFLASFQSLWARDLCPSLKKFEFSSNDTTSTLFNPQSYLDSACDMFSCPAVDENDRDDYLMDQQPDHYSDDDNGDEFAHQAGFGDAEDFVADKSNDIPLILGEMQQVCYAAEDIVDEDGEVGLAQSGIEAFSFFDASANKNWIGPEHWRPSRNTAPKKTAAAASEEKPKKKKSAPAVIDFNAPPVDLKVICEVGKTTINLPKASYKSSNLLPDKDYNFTADKMVSLFIRPKFKLTWKMRDGTTRKQVLVPVNGDAVQPVAAPVLGNDEHVDPDVGFWAERQDDVPVFQESLEPVEQAAAYDDDDVQGYYGNDSDDDDETHNISLLANTIGGISLDFGDQLVDAPRRVTAHQLSYSRVAKKVDVKRLKDNMWKSVTTVVEADGESVEKPDCKFTEVMHGLGGFYPEKKMRDISVAFCFICLLHLANEEGLEIQMDRETSCGVEAKGMDELIIQFPVGP